MNKVHSSIIHSVCRVCGVDKPILHHHIVPKSRGGVEDTLWCCSDCGNQLHMLFTNKELGELGLAVFKTEAMVKYIAWKKKHPGKHTYRASNKVKDWKKGHR